MGKPINDAERQLEELYMLLNGAVRSYQEFMEAASRSREGMIRTAGPAASAAQQVTTKARAMRDMLRSVESSVRSGRR